MEGMRRLAFTLPFLFIALFAVYRTAAQEAAPAKMFITWKPATYAPAFYEGRLLPTVGSRVTASVFALQNGHLVELAGKTIYWYLNDEFIEGGADQQTVEFRLPNELPNMVADLMVRLPDTAEGLVKTIEIPIIAPRAVIDAPFPRSVVTGPSFTVRALPYFFNIRSTGQLVYSWSVNGEQPSSEDPANLTVNIEPGSAPGSPIVISLNLRNPISYFELGGDSAGFILGQ